jgi:hypothetical protein
MMAEIYDVLVKGKTVEDEIPVKEEQVNIKVESLSASVMMLMLRLSQKAKKGTSS